MHVRCNRFCNKDNSRALIEPSAMAGNVLAFVNGPCLPLTALHHCNSSDKPSPTSLPTLTRQIRLNMITFIKQEFDVIVANLSVDEKVVSDGGPLEC